MKNVIAAVCAATISVVAHGVGLMRDQVDAVDIPAAAPPRQVQLGNHFESHTMGAISSVEPVAAAPAPASSLAATSAPTITPTYAAQMAAPPTTPEPIEPVREQTALTAVETGPRPIVRPENLRPPQQRASQGAAQQNTVAGAQRATAPVQTPAAAPSGQGVEETAVVTTNSRAARNYGNVVMRKISRTRRVSTGIRGRTLVAFAIGGTGALDSVSVANSSGNAELDTLAVDHIRRAAPFDPPPEGAQRRFSVVIEGR
ncbi:hypothetical protein BVC71_15045 [Marivivens niveibacter]|uniref:TonB C-terminal domain-containing protein n=1 Tax=Marivivens niveibacter TaxID=1930667 RepID=A0A251WUN2_9RHOB|nr:TonB family protein [Marivivens niveibacter]OUD08122.1 hypothetical protein BVC71_15045 [Marivivens niveibacter]